MSVYQQDFENQLNHRCEEAVRAMGRKSAQIIGDWAAQGALGNSRIVIAFTDALEAEWRSLVGGTVEDMRAFADATGISRPRLMEAARGKLVDLLPALQKASRVERPENGYPARVLTGDSLKRVEALVPYLDLKFRQFELGV